MKSSKKYYPLHQYLDGINEGQTVELDFAKIEEIINAKLPQSARSTRAWWANTLTPQSESWLASGWLVDHINFPAERVIFRQKNIPHRVTPIHRRPGWSPEKVKELRKHAGWSQQELADQMGVRQQTVSEWETGLHKPRYSTSKHLNLIAKEVDFPYEVKDEGTPNQNN